MNVPELYTRPAFNLTSIASVPLRNAATGLSGYISEIQYKRQPILQAFAFYLLDHFTALIKSKYPSETIPDDLAEVVDLYHGMTTRFGMDMYAYLLLICNREFRYCKSEPSSYKQHLGDSPATDFGISIRSTSSDGAYNKLKAYSGDATLGAYCEVMTNGYNKLGWSSAYGGKKWGDIAKVLENYVLGKIPLMTLLDQSFSLQHNTCAIFNKGTVYEKESSHLLALLDLQHAGQMIGLAYDLFFGGMDGLNLRGQSQALPILKALKEAFIVMASHFEGLDQHVDWVAVKAGNPATSQSMLSSYEKEWYANFGIYTVTQKGTVHKAVEPEQKDYYHISPKEGYVKVKRKKG